MTLTTATHPITIRPMPANENGRGNLAGFEAVCDSCGPIGTNTFRTNSEAEGRAHQRWIASLHRKTAR